MTLREEPYISSNKLAEYMNATPQRRKQIIKQQKRPPSGIVSRYTPIEIAATDYLSAKERSDEIVYRQLERLCFQNTSTRWRRERKELCIEAAEAFLDIAKEFRLGGVDFEKCNRTQQRSFELAGVVIGIRPEILLSGHDRHGNVVAGAVKLHFSKSHRLDEISGPYASTLVHHYMAAYSTNKTLSNFCFVIDVFGRRVFQAPRAYARQLSNLEAGCEEIARAWKDV